MDKEVKAILEEIVKGYGSLVYDNEWGECQCCGEHANEHTKEWASHKPDCIVSRAQRLLDAEKV